MQKKYISYDDVAPLLDPKKKTIHVVHADDQNKSALRALIRLANAFNKTVCLKIGKKTVRIKKGAKLKDVFAACKKQEAARLAYKPSAKDIADLARILREGDDSPWALLQRK